MYAPLVTGGLGALGAALLWRLCFSHAHGHQGTGGLQLRGSSAEHEGLEWESSVGRGLHWGAPGKLAKYRAIFSSLPLCWDWRQVNVCTNF